MYHLSRNWKLYIFLLLFMSGSGVYMFDKPEHVGFKQATISNVIASGPTQERVVYARLDNGIQVKIKYFPNSAVQLEKRVKVEHSKSPIIGLSSYRFIEFIKEGK